MNQPELGKKIVELRKAQSLTQEELVEACNLNVRTLQRIESGEVTPRSYTLKLISEALDFDFNVSLLVPETSTKKQRYFDWIKPVYDYATDLFNLKTDTMRKVMTFSTLALAIAVCLMSFKTNDENTQRTNEARKSIESIKAQYQQWYEKGQMDSCATTFSDDVCLVNNWLVLHGKNAIMEQLFSVIPRRYRNLESNIETFNHSGNIVVIRGSSTDKDIDGNIFHSKYMEEWHYIDGKWLQVNGLEVYQQ